MTDQAQERVDVIRAVLNRAFPATAHGLLPNEVDDAIRAWESHIPRERADADGLIADAYQLIDWWLNNPDHVPENRGPMARGWIERAARWAAGEERCLCGALRSEHHASSLVSSGCVVSPQVAHSCPCVKFAPIAHIPRERPRSPR